jgi:hypothetical protein
MGSSGARVEQSCVRKPQTVRPNTSFAELPLCSLEDASDRLTSDACLSSYSRSLCALFCCLLRSAASLFWYLLCSMVAVLLCAFPRPRDNALVPLQPWRVPGLQRLISISPCVQRLINWIPAYPVHLLQWPEAAGRVLRVPCLRCVRSRGAFRVQQLQALHPHHCLPEARCRRTSSASLAGMLLQLLRSEKTRYSRGQ